MRAFQSLQSGSVNCLCMTSCRLSIVRYVRVFVHVCVFVDWNLLCMYILRALHCRRVYSQVIIEVISPNYVESTARVRGVHLIMWNQLHECEEFTK